jgi:hypothetical protein
MQGSVHQISAAFYNVLLGGGSGIKLFSDPQNLLKDLNVNIHPHSSVPI